jgi:glutamyl/glutaminyl-tRNA synthetase
MSKPPFVTRFNPTANGELHLGHLYVILFNEHVARASGGRFLVRFEENTIDSLYTISAAQMGRYCDSQREIIQWLGIQVDGYRRQSALELQLKEFVAHHGWYIPAFRWPFSIPINAALGDYNPEEGEWYPYAPYLTFCKVIYDALTGVNVLVRGDDLRSEFALYQYFRAEFGLEEVDHYFLPRLYGPNDEIISKFHGAQPLTAYRKAGWTPADIIEALARSALKEPARGWRLDNVKARPRLIEALGLPLGDNHRAGIGAIDDDVWTDQSRISEPG